MGRIIDMPLPRLGETMEEGRIIAWLKQPGETFRRGETLLEVETDKTVVECPALMDGKLVEHLVKAEDRVPVDAAIARVEVEGEAPVAFVPAITAPVPYNAKPKVIASPHPVSGKVRASGKARSVARRTGTDLTKLSGTGRGGRIVAQDVVAAGQGQSSARVILIHGLFADAASFALLKLMLERSGFVVMAIDLPGHGASTKSAATLDEAIQAVETELPAGDLVLVGHSLGAIVAARIAARLGARVKHLILLSPAGFGIDINGAFIDAMMNARNEDQLLDALQMLGPVKASRAFAGAQLQRMADGRGTLTRLVSSVTEGSFQKVAITRDLAKLAMPVTAVFSRDDPIVPAHHALAAPGNVEVRMISGCGHVPHWFKADFIVGLLKR